MNNAEISEIFDNIAGLLEMKDEQLFKVRAYQRVARAIGHLPSEVAQMVRDGKSLQEIPGIGKAIAEKITQLVTTGKMPFYENLKAEFPEGILEIMHVPGVGPKTTRRLWKELGVTTVAELEAAATDGRVAAMERMGVKKAENILKEIHSTSVKETRIPIARAMPAAERVVAALKAQCPGILRLEIAGSLRRYEETIGNIDLVCATPNPGEVIDALVKLPNVTGIPEQGDAKASVVLSEGIQVDLRIVDESSFGTAVQYFTGGEHHNERLREYAGKLGLSVSEHEVTNTQTGDAQRFAAEEDFYSRLGLQHLPPELRQGSIELDAAGSRTIPQLVELRDLKGDLHVHTNWSDGRATRQR
ncbi:MAG: hypothetical protein FJ319_01395 [SAR202 cluster bacterium]|nr:hypothetical protein [SAR202 cluster bacterium]